MSKHHRQFPGATAYFDRHGARRWRYRAKGFAVELGRDYGSDEFVARYEAALKRQRLKGQVGKDPDPPRFGQRPGGRLLRLSGLPQSRPAHAQHICWHPRPLPA
jgi:hypothetical protein